jgi:hypothetical protein
LDFATAICNYLWGMKKSGEQEADIAWKLSNKLYTTGCFFLKGKIMIYRLNWTVTGIGFGHDIKTGAVDL